LASGFLQELFVFVLAVFVGFALITKIPSLLHTPLMSATNAIHGVIVAGSLVVAVVSVGSGQTLIGVAAVLLGTLNVVGGYVVTDRMLEMFKKSPTRGESRG
jgi:NAD(P) transhydrogenase subunit alpha